MTLRRLITCFLVIFVFFGSHEARSEGIKKRKKGLILKAEYKRAYVSDMFTQIPSGGNPGTTSSERPDKDDIGLNHINIPTFSLGYRYHAHALKLGATLIKIDESFRLDKPLRYHNQDYFPGITYDFEQRLYYYSLNYSYALNSGNFEFKPAVEIGVFDFMVNIDDEFGKPNRRSFGHRVLRVGGSLEWDLNESFYLNGQAMYGVPIGKSFENSGVGLKAGYRFSVLNIPEISFETGLHYHHIEFRDDQTKPNHILLELYPTLTAGIILKF